jgi:UDP-glucose 4-epimerase
MAGKVVLITGVSGYWGSRVAARLVAEEDHHVIGLDLAQPEEKIDDLDFIQADVRNALLTDLLAAEEVDTVCHLAFMDTAQLSEMAFDVNVIGTMKVLGACAEARVRKIVLKSSTAVYGARPSNSAFLTENHALRGSRRYGYTRDLMEIEAFCNAFRHQAPEIILTVLRFCSIVGPTVDTPLTRFLREPWAPTLLGFDPRMQIIHENDVVAAVVHAVLNDVPGVFNVAAEEVLPLNKIRGLAGKPPISILHPFAYWTARYLGGRGLQTSRYAPIELDYIRYAWVADLTRMREEFGFEPVHTAEETLREFAEQHHPHRYLSDAPDPDYGEARLRDILEQRRRQGERQAVNPQAHEEGQADE